MGFHTCAFPQPHEIIKTQGSSLPIRLHGRIKTTTKKLPKPKTIHCIYPGETALAQCKIASLMLPQSLKRKSYEYLVLLIKSHLKSWYEMTLFHANKAYPVYEAL